MAEKRSVQFPTKRREEEPSLYSDEVYERVSAWLEERWDDEPVVCPVCKDTRWDVGEVIELHLHEMPSQFYPAVPLFCGECGYIFLLSGIAVGIQPAKAGVAEVVGPNAPDDDADAEDDNEPPQ